MEKEQVLSLYDLLGRMKALKRAGWVKRRVKNPESDADHSYSLAILVLLLTPEYLDLQKCLKLALVHDLPEAFCGDFIPGEIAFEEKKHLEHSAMQKIAADLKQPQLLELFTEYQQHSTLEAEFVHTLDRLDNVFTARFYEKKSSLNLTDEFANSALPQIEDLKDENLRNELLKILQILR